MLWEVKNGAQLFQYTNFFKKQSYVVDHSNNLADFVGFGIHHCEYFWWVDSCPACHSAGGDSCPIVARQEGIVE